jgi:uncharacterized protein GlcG (DUF336 family)
MRLPSANLQTESVLKTRSFHSVSSEFAVMLMRAAVKRATKLGINVCVAIAGTDGHILALQRMDAAPVLCLRISQDKAITAATFGSSSRALYSTFCDVPSVRDGLPHFSGFTFLGGGCPAIWQGQVIGGIGVSGGSEDQDIECAEAALELLNDSALSSVERESSSVQSHEKN